MAKKQATNILEAHLEKIVLAVVLAICVCIIFSQLLSPVGSGDDTDLSPSELARKAAAQAENIESGLARTSPDKKDWPPYPSIREDLIYVEPLASIPLDKIPLNPPLRLLSEDEKYRNPYVIPDIPSLANAKIDFTRALVVLPGDPEDLSPAATSGSQAKTGDVDFVTVEAVFPLSELYQKFQNNFVDTVEKPPLYPGPIVADTQLQQAMLLPGRAWSPWRTLPRLAVDPLKNERSLDAINSLSLAPYEFLLERKQSPLAQQLTLKPEPYRLLNREWLSPSEKIEQEALEQKKGRDAARREVRDSRSGRTPPGQTESSGRTTGAGMTGGRRTSSGRTNRTSPDADWLNQKEITLWAFDEQVESAGVYRYRLRLGFFNPIAGHDSWFTPQQQHLTDQKILWSPWIEPKNVIRIPERIAFFLKSEDSRQEGVDIDVRRWQNEQWHEKTFPVSPGAVIGRPAKPDVKRRPRRETERDSSRTASPRQEIERVDFTTDITLIDIIPNSQHIQQKRTSITDLPLTTDIIYSNSQGQILRLGLDKRSWPTHLASLYSRIDKAIKEQEKDDTPSTSGRRDDRTGNSRRPDPSDRQPLRGRPLRNN